MIFIGIDPGQKGAIVYLQGDTVGFAPLPIRKDGTLNALQAQAILQNWRSVYPPDTISEHWLAIIEQPPYGFGPKTGIKPIVSLHKSFEAWRILLDLHEIAWYAVTPISWKKHFQLIGKPKGRACTLAKTWLGLELDPKALKDQGIADAALLALYGRQRWTGVMP